MRRIELLGMLSVSVALVTTGLTWLFGPYGLIGCGVVLFIASFFIAEE